MYVSYIYYRMADEKKDFDAIVVGSGPNGLSAAIVLQQAGLSVLLLEAKDTVGGGLRSAALTLPGFTHDICSAIHPLAVGSPFFQKLPLSKYGLEFIYPSLPAAHPFDDGTAAILDYAVENTARLLDSDEKNYLRLIAPLVKDWPKIARNVLGPLQYPRYPVTFSRFGLKALQPASWIAKYFSSEKAKGLWAGMAAHSMLPLHHPATSAIGLILLTTAHKKGWPVAKGGSQAIADALAAHFVALGGKIETNFHVKSLEQLPSSRAVLFDVTPRQLLEIAGYKFSSIYKWQLQKYKYGMGVFKVDWALDSPIPFRAAECRLAGTVHLGNTFQEISYSELQAWKGKHAEKPFVLLAQASVADPTRAPQGKHTGWAYCHVPPGSTQDMTKAIEDQVERFAPGFRERILKRSTRNSEDMEAYNFNYIGGDINGGAFTISQIFTRPALRFSPYRSSAKGIYICSSATPPGGGVHGMCGYYAAVRALKDVFNIRLRL
jgi:phytoene dehydrogenase-like protein